MAEEPHQSPSEESRDGRADRVVSVGPIRLDPTRHEVAVRGRTVLLTRTEFRLLFALCEYPGWVMSPETLVERVWGYDSLGDTRVVAVHISNLRRKIEDDPHNPSLIVTVRGVGYKIEAGEDSPDDSAKAGPRTEAGRPRDEAEGTLQLVAAAAVIGERFDLSLVGAALEVPPASLLDPLDELVLEGVFLADEEVGFYAFADSQARLEAYESITPGRRVLYHARIAGALSESLAGTVTGEVLIAAADHLAKSLPAADLGWALDFGVRLAGLLVEGGHQTSAASVLERVVAKAETMPSPTVEERAEIASVAEKMGDMRLSIPDLLGAADAFERAAAWTDEQDHLDKARRLRKAGAAYESANRLADAHIALAAAEAVLESHGIERGQTWWSEWIETRLALAWVLYFEKSEQLGPALEDIGAVVERRASPYQKAAFYHRLMSDAHIRNRFRVTPQSLEWAKRSLEILETHDAGTKEMCFAHFVLGFAYLWSGSLHEAEEHLMVAQGMALKARDRLQEIRTLTYLTVVTRMRGDCIAAGWHAYRALRTAAVAGKDEYVSAAHANLAWIALKRGNPGAARQKAEYALAEWRKDALSYPFEWLALWPLAEVCVEEGDLGAAADCIDRLLCPPQQRPPDELEDACADVIRLRAEGDEEALRSALLRACRLARRYRYL